MNPYIEQPKRISIILRVFIWIAERKVGKKLLPARILAWYPKSAIGAGIMEGLIAHEEGKANARLLKLIRMQVSILSSCSFCIDMNSSEYAEYEINENEIEALQGKKNLEDINSFSLEEIAALKYAKALTSTPISIEGNILKEFLSIFNEKEFVVIVSTIAQVNFWTRMIQGVGIPPAGFSESCSILDLDKYSTLKKELGPNLEG